MMVGRAHPQRLRSTDVAACDRRVYLLARPSPLVLTPGGSSVSGKMRRRTITITPPQQRQSNLGRSVWVADSVGVLAQVLKTNRRSSAINLFSSVGLNQTAKNVDCMRVAT